MYIYNTYISPLIVIYKQIQKFIIVHGANVYCQLLRYVIHYIMST